VDHDGGVHPERCHDEFCAARRWQLSGECPGGGKRAQTAMAPVIVTDQSGAPVLVGGSAGAGEIVDYVAQAVLELLSGTSAGGST
jgi:gamma-glutamyltranspeptidase